MRTAAIVRNTDTLGRITLPIEMRKTLGIEPGKKSPFEIIPTKEGILVRPYNGYKICSCCGDHSNSVISINNVSLCRSCVNKFWEVDS